MRSYLDTEKPAPSIAPWIWIAWYWRVRICLRAQFTLDADTRPSRDGSAVQQTLPTGVPNAAAIIAELSAPHPPAKSEEKPAGEKVVQVDLGKPAAPELSSGPGPTANGKPEEPKLASADAAEHATLPTAPPSVEAAKETNGADKPADPVPEPPTAAATSAPEKPAEAATEAAKSTETLPTNKSPTDTVTTNLNGQIKEFDPDAEMKEAFPVSTAAAPAEAAPGPPTESPAELVTENLLITDAVTVPIDDISNKRKAEDALGPDADADADAAAGKKAKTADEAKPVEQTKVEEAAPAKADAAETNVNGGGDAPLVARAKKGGRPKKQAAAKPAVPAGRTERKTRSQGPAA